MRFYEGLSIFAYGEALERTETKTLPKPSQDESPQNTSAEIIVIGSGPGGAITAALLAEAGRDVLLLEAGPNL
ncbi:MAG: GMC family oxidoreductase, partial [Xanthobacteraceae bacterium]|nr:GMC family oxidoreductase [Xanthobacteraceae bacterium]